jgi:hypothetical protein
LHFQNTAKYLLEEEEEELELDGSNNIITISPDNPSAEEFKSFKGSKTFIRKHFLTSRPAEDAEDADNDAPNYSITGKMVKASPLSSKRVS